MNLPHKHPEMRGERRDWREISGEFCIISFNFILLFRFVCIPLTKQPAVVAMIWGC